MFVTVLIRSLILNFGITLATELLVALVWKLRTPRELVAVALVNLITNPPLTMTMTWIRFSSIGLYSQWFLVFFEPIIVFLEGFLYKRALPQLSRPYLFSLVANLSSVLCGYAIVGVWYFLISRR